MPLPSSKPSAPGSSSSSLARQHRRCSCTSPQGLTHLLPLLLLLQLHRPAGVSSTYCLFLPVTLSSCCPLPGFPFLLLMVNMAQPKNEAEVFPLLGSLPGPTFLPFAPDTPSCLCSQVDGVLLCVLPEGCLLWILEPCNYSHSLFALAAGILRGPF